MTDGSHIAPIDDLMEHTPDEECWCGPTPELVTTVGGDVWNYIHHSLDGREHDEPDHDKTSCPRCTQERDTPNTPSPQPRP